MIEVGAMDDRHSTTAIKPVRVGARPYGGGGGNEYGSLEYQEPSGTMKGVAVCGRREPVVYTARSSIATEEVKRWEDVASFSGVRVELWYIGVRTRAARRPRWVELYGRRGPSYRSHRRSRRHGMRNRVGYGGGEQLR